MTNYCTNKFTFDDLCYIVCNQNTDITDITLRETCGQSCKNCPKLLNSTLTAIAPPPTSFSKVSHRQILVKSCMVMVQQFNAKFHAFPKHGWA